MDRTIRNPCIGLHREANAHRNGLPIRHTVRWIGLEVVNPDRRADVATGLEGGGNQMQQGGSEEKELHRTMVSGTP